MSLLFLLVILICYNVWLVSCVSQPKTIFLLGGQSNMAGRGGVTYYNDSTGHRTSHWDGIVPLECQPNPEILKLDANLNWVEAREPLHIGIDVNTTHGIGPGMPFAHAILKMKPNFGSIGLVPCAHHLSSISQWQRNSQFYTLMMKRAAASIKNGAVIGGLLWWQGGADANDTSKAESFKNNTLNFFNNVRADLKLPQLPIMQVAIRNGTSRLYIKIVREAQLSINLPNLITVDSDGKPFEKDDVHLTSQGQVMLGTELAKEYLSL